MLKFEINVDKQYLNGFNGAKNLFTKIQIYDDKVLAQSESSKAEWYFAHFKDITFFSAHTKCPFASIKFINGTNNVVGFDDLRANRSANASDLNSILFNAGLWQQGKTNLYAKDIYQKIKQSFDEFKNK